MTARERYNQLATGRSQFLDSAVECSKLTLPYLITDDNAVKLNRRSFVTPWQSVGAKAV